MKKTLTMAATALLMAACTGNTDKNTFQIEGTAQNMADGKQLVLADNMGHEVDTLVITDGKFSYTGRADSAVMYSLYPIDDDKNNVNFFSEPGTISITISTDPNDSRVKGTPSNDGLQQLIDATASFYEKMGEIEQELYGDSTMNHDNEWALTERYKQLLNEVGKIFVEVAAANIDNETGYMLVSGLIDEQAYADTLKQLIAQMPPQFRERQAIVDLEARMKASDAVKPGNTIDNFTMETPDGTALNVMSEVSKNKVTILDFWASWCGPCRREMPFMKELYAKYHQKGLGIVGISLDESGDAWGQAIDDMKIEWPQMSDLQGWNCAAARLFEVNSIPFLVVVDQQGVILQKGLRGQELEQFIASLLD